MDHSRRRPTEEAIVTGSRGPYVEGVSDMADTELQ